VLKNFLTAPGLNRILLGMGFSAQAAPFGSANLAALTSASRTGVRKGEKSKPKHPLGGAGWTFPPAG